MLLLAVTVLGFILICVKMGSVKGCGDDAFVVLLSLLLFAFLISIMHDVFFLLLFGVVVNNFVDSNMLNDEATVAVVSISLRVFVFNSLSIVVVVATLSYCNTDSERGK